MLNEIGLAFLCNTDSESGAIIGLRSDSGVNDAVRSPIL